MSDVEIFLQFQDETGYDLWISRIPAPVHVAAGEVVHLHDAIRTSADEHAPEDVVISGFFQVLHVDQSFQRRIGYLKPGMWSMMHFIVATVRPVERPVGFRMGG